MKPHFGNGGAVATLLSTAAERAELRLSGLPTAERARSVELLPEDFIPVGDAAAISRKADPTTVLEGLVGCDAVKQQIREIQATIEDAKSDGRDPLDTIDMVFSFTGPPGTGKTTVARRMGKLFEALDLLAAGDTFVQCSATDLQTGYVGQAAKKTREKFEEAKGGVLFIDEAYRLYDPKGTTFMKEAVDEIVNLLTEEEFKGKMCVIFAGYEAEIDEMMSKVNPGLKSRVTMNIRFDAFDSKTTSELFVSQLAKNNKHLSAKAMSLLPALSEVLVKSPGFASGRDIETWCKRVTRDCASARTKEVSDDILRESLAKMLGERDRRTTLAAAEDTADYLPAFEFPAGPQERPRVAARPTTTTTVLEAEEAEAEVFGGNNDDGDEAGAIQAALQKACVSLGYDKDLISRQLLVVALKGIEAGGSFPKKIVEFVSKEVGGADETKIDKALRPQISALLTSVQAAIVYEVEENARLAAMAEAEREQEKARVAKIQTKLMGICPAGFQWHPEGAGWRCGGGAHWVRDSAL